MFTGVPEPDARTTDECKAACSRNPSCVAIDYDTNLPSGRCFLHLSQANLITQSRSLGVNNYVIRRVCGPQTTTDPNICEDTFQEFPGQGSIGATPISGVFTLSACRERCISQISCVAIDYNSLPASLFRCWIHSDMTNLANMYSDDGVTQYRITRCPFGKWVEGAVWWRAQARFY